MKNYSQEIIEFLNEATSAYTSVASLKEKLEQAGYKEYDLKSSLPQFGYYTRNGSDLIIFAQGSDVKKHGIKLYGAHLDSPCLKIKPRALDLSEEVYRLNTEVYGGPILNTWFDRPLSLSGRVAVKVAEDILVLCLDFKKPILILPNVAIHMNREVNNGVKIERHKVLLPFLAFGEEKVQENYFEELIVQQIKKEHGLEISSDKILDFDLYTYEAVPAMLVGVNEDLISAGRLDDLAMCHIGMKTAEKLVDADFEGLKIIFFTDHEEIGSRSQQGADSNYLKNFLDHLLYRLGFKDEDFLAVFNQSYLLSSDLAHAVHPNYAHYADPHHKPYLGKGPVIKTSAAQSYATSLLASAIFKDACQKLKVPYQEYVNRSDMRGGSTIGPLIAKSLPIHIIDLGTAIWAMHSARETGAVIDLVYMQKVIDYLMLKD